MTSSAASGGAGVTPSLRAMSISQLRRTPGRHAVVAVVVGEVRQDPRRPRPAPPQRRAHEPRRTARSSRRPSARRWFARRRPCTALELLDRVRARTDAHRPQHERYRSTNTPSRSSRSTSPSRTAVPRRHRHQVRGLIGRVVIDVHAGVRGPAAHSRSRGTSRAPASRRRRCAPTAPSTGRRCRPTRRGSRSPNAPRRRRRLRVERVALEVEEDVAMAGQREGMDRRA